MLVTQLLARPTSLAAVAFVVYGQVSFLRPQQFFALNISAHTRGLDGAMRYASSDRQNRPPADSITLTLLFLLLSSSPSRARQLSVPPLVAFNKDTMRVAIRRESLGLMSTFHQAIFALITRPMLIDNTLPNMHFTPSLRRAPRTSHYQ